HPGSQSGYSGAWTFTLAAPHRVFPAPCFPSAANDLCCGHRMSCGGLMRMLKTLIGACFLALLAAAPARAQTTPLPYGPPIGIEGARAVMAAAENEAAKNNWAVVISIIDSGGNIVMLHRHNDVQLSSIEISQGKAKTALMFKRPSKVLDDAISSGGTGLRFLALKDIVPLEGGIPIVIDGKIVGAIGVSGVLSAQDAQIARAGIDALK